MIEKILAGVLSVGLSCCGTSPSAPRKSSQEIPKIEWSDEVNIGRKLHSFDISLDLDESCIHQYMETAVAKVFIDIGFKTPKLVCCMHPYPSGDYSPNMAVTSEKISYTKGIFLTSNHLAKMYVLAVDGYLDKESMISSMKDGLSVPDFSDERVSRLTNALVESIVLHEAGHLYHQHIRKGMVRPYISRREHEDEADNFMRDRVKTREGVIGALLFDYYALLTYPKQYTGFDSHSPPELRLERSLDNFKSRGLVLDEFDWMLE